MRNDMNDSRASALEFTLIASSVALIVLAGWFIRSGNFLWAVTPLIIAVGCLSFASISKRAPQSAPSRSADVVDAPDASKLEFREKLFGAFAGAAAALLMSISLTNFADENSGNLTIAWWSFGVAVTLALAAAPAMDRRWSRLIAKMRDIDAIAFRPHSIIPLAALFGILILAASLRLYSLDTIPAGLWFDEADNLAHAQMYANDPGRTPLYTPSTNLPTMFLLPIALVIELAGMSITAGRLVSVAFGLLGVVAVFMFARHALGTRVGLVAAFLVASMRWDINWSRIGMHGITATLFAALSGWLTLRALSSRKLSDYAFAGAALGLGMWFYASFRMFPLVIGFMLAHHFVIQRPPIRAFAARVAVMSIAAMFAAAPILQFAADSPEVFFARTQTTSLFEITPREQWAGQIVDGFLKHILMFVHEGDTNPRHNLPGAPMLDFLTGALFVLGLLFALTRWRSLTLFALPMWILLMLLPGMLTIPWEHPQSLRTLLVVPAAAALVAYIIVRLWDAARVVPWPRVRRFSTPAILALLGIIAYANVDTYFGSQASDPRVYAAFSTDQTLMAHSQIEQQGHGHTLWISRQFMFGRTSSLLAGEPRYEVISAPRTLPMDSTKVWNGASAYFEPRERGFWEVMRAYYPDGEYAIVTPPGGGEPMYYTGFVSRELLAERQGLNARCYADDADIPCRISSASETVWHADMGAPEYPHEVRLNGALHIVEDGEYEFELDAPASAVVELNGIQILGDGIDSALVVPALGIHSLSIRSRISSSNDYMRLLWRPPGAEYMTPIPFTKLYRDTVHPIGMAGRFFAGDSYNDSADIPDHTQITPTMDMFYYNPLIPEPYTAIWEGHLNIASDGRYEFGVRLEGAGSIALYIDDALIARYPPNSDANARGETPLTTGSHRIRVEYRPESPPSQFQILWLPPDGGRMEPVPVEVLTPATEYMLRITD